MLKYGEITTKLEVLEGASKGIDMSFLSEIEVLKEKVNNLSESHEHGHTTMLVNKKEIELLKVQIQEIKVKSTNPLATN